MTQSDKNKKRMNPGVVFTEKYLKLMFKQLRDATPEEVRIPRYFKGYFTEEKFTASTGFEMQVFKHDEASQHGVRSLSLSKGRLTEMSDGRPKHKLILYLHGGAFIYPPVFFHWRFLHDLCLRTHCDAMLPVYPKSPEYDCKYCVSTLLEFYQNVIHPSPYDEVHLVGDSAGACLCLILAQEAHKNGWRKPTTLTLLSPCVDLSHTKEKEMRALQEKDSMLQLDRVIALNAIWQGKFLQPDVLFLKETYEKAGKTGVFREYEGMFHTFAMFPIPQGFAALKEMVEGIKRH